MTPGDASPGSSTKRLAALVTLRMLIGWHFLYEGLVKLLNPNWSAAEFLAQSQGLFSGIFHWFLGDPARLAAVDFLNRWGLVLIGAGLIAGFLTRYATMAAMLLLALYYLCNPPLPFYTYSMPAEGSYLLVNKVLIELAALWVLLAFPTGGSVGLDRLFIREGRGGDVR
jgi:thiosulfate dehydrogenase (quinone) large subunit